MKINAILQTPLWKDPALIGIAIMLLLYGSGKFGLDYLISKRKSHQLAEHQKRTI